MRKTLAAARAASMMGGCAAPLAQTPQAPISEASCIELTRRAQRLFGSVNTNSVLLFTLWDELISRCWTRPEYQSCANLGVMSEHVSEIVNAVNRCDDDPEPGTYGYAAQEARFTISAELRRRC